MRIERAIATSSGSDREEHSTITENDPRSIVGLAVDDTDWTTVQGDWRTAVAGAGRCQLVCCKDGEECRTDHTCALYAWFV